MYLIKFTQNKAEYVALWLQPWKTVLKPKGLKPHQLRPEDIKQQRMDGLDNSVYEQKSMFTAL